MAISRRSAGRRAICRPARARETRPRRRRARRAERTRPSGWSACASSRPPAMASRPGREQRDRPAVAGQQRGHARPRRPPLTAPSTSPTCRVDARGGTRRSSDEPAAAAASVCRRRGSRAARRPARPAPPPADRPPGLHRRPRAPATARPLTDGGRASPARRRAPSAAEHQHPQLAQQQHGGADGCRARAAGPARSPVAAARWPPRRRTPAPRCPAPRAATASSGMTLRGLLPLHGGRVEQRPDRARSPRPPTVAAPRVHGSAVAALHRRHARSRTRSGPPAGARCPGGCVRPGHGSPGQGRPRREHLVDRPPGRLLPGRRRGRRGGWLRRVRPSTRP